MTPRNDDEPYASDDDREFPRRRSRRDVLDVGVNDGAARRARTNARDLDEDRDDDRRRDDDRDDDRSRRSDRDARRGGDRDDDRRDDRTAREKSKGDRDEGRKAKSDDKGSEKDASDKDADQSHKDGEDRRKGRRPLIITIAVIVVLLLIAGGIYYWLSTRGKTSTDDAYTDGNIVALAPRISGQVVSLDVTDNQFVHKGDPIIHIDSRPFVFDREQARGAVDTAKAQLASQKLGVEISKKNFPAGLLSAQGALTSARANLLLQEANYNRQKNLSKQATTQQEVDSATASFQQAEAQVQEAQARVTQAEPVQQNIGQSEEQVGQLNGQAEQAQSKLDTADLNVEFTVVRAPQDGWVTRRNVNAGNYVSAGTQIMSLVTTDTWVTANFKETELDGMRPGQAVTIEVDAYPDLALKGHVDSIQKGSGSKFSAFPAENATGNFVKIVQRVPVKIVIDSGLNPTEPLPLGVSVVPTVMLK